jgi:hypothetical protein
MQPCSCSALKLPLRWATQQAFNFLRALGQLLDLLPAHEHFAFGLEDFGAAAELGGGLVEDAVALRSQQVVPEIRDDQHHAREGKDGQRRLLFHGSFRSALDLAQTISPAVTGVKPRLRSGAFIFAIQPFAWFISGLGLSGAPFGWDWLLTTPSPLFFVSVDSKGR